MEPKTYDEGVQDERARCLAIIDEVIRRSTPESSYVGSVVNVAVLALRAAQERILKP